MPEPYIPQIRDLVYGHKDGLALVMDVCKPQEPNGAAILYMFSGGFRSGSELIASGLFGPDTFEPYLRRGYTVFIVAHGAKPRYAVNEIVNDIHRAVRFVRFHANDHDIDADRLGIFGISSGGYLSLMIGTTGGPGDEPSSDPVDRESSRVAAIGAFCPPVDFLDYGPAGESILEFRSADYVWSSFDLDGQPADEQRRQLTNLSPINHISVSTPPTFLMHGERDPLVLVQQSERFAAKLAEFGVLHELIIRKGGKHGWPNMVADHGLVAGWFDKYLN